MAFALATGCAQPGERDDRLLAEIRAIRAESAADRQRVLALQQRVAELQEARARDILSASAGANAQPAPATEPTPTKELPSEASFSTFASERPAQSRAMPPARSRPAIPAESPRLSLRRERSLDVDNPYDR